MVSLVCRRLGGGVVCSSRRSRLGIRVGSPRRRGSPPTSQKFGTCAAFPLLVALRFVR